MAWAGLVHERAVTSPGDKLCSTSMTTGLIIRGDRLRRKLVAAAPVTYVTPRLVDLRAQLLPSNNQGTSSECAAFALAGCLEFHNWKREGVAEQIDPYPIYKRAKEIDEMPNVEGTTLEAAVQAAMDLGLLSWLDNAGIREVISADQVKRAMHRSGVLLAAFNITDQWSFADAEGWIPEGGQMAGGHAVCLCSYDQVFSRPYFGFQGSWGNQGWRGFNRLSPEQFRMQFSYALAFEG